MTEFELYKQVENALFNANIPDYNTESKIIVENCLEKPFAKILMNKALQIPVSQCEQQKCDCAVKRRVHGIPVQYILGHWNFYGRDFLVGEGVLIPRSDTEFLIDVALKYAAEQKKNAIISGADSPNFFQRTQTTTIADLCSGSGCVAITLAKEIKNSKVFAYEISTDAISFLKKNKAANEASNMQILKGDILNDSFLQNQHLTYDIIVSNPPYIPTSTINSLQKEVLYEPIIALDGGEDGLLFYRKIIGQWKTKLKKNGLLAVEIGFNQGETVMSMFRKNGFSTAEIIKDYDGNDRVVAGLL